MDSLQFDSDSQVIVDSGKEAVTMLLLWSDHQQKSRGVEMLKLLTAFIGVQGSTGAGQVGSNGGQNTEFEKVFAALGQEHQTFGEQPADKKEQSPKAGDGAQANVPDGSVTKIDDEAEPEQRPVETEVWVEPQARPQAQERTAVDGRTDLSNNVLPTRDEPADIDHAFDSPVDSVSRKQRPPIEALDHADATLFAVDRRVKTPVEDTGLPLAHPLTPRSASKHETDAAHQARETTENPAPRAFSKALAEGRQARGSGPSQSHIPPPVVASTHERDVSVEHRSLETESALASDLARAEAEVPAKRPAQGREPVFQQVARPEPLAENLEVSSGGTRRKAFDASRLARERFVLSGDTEVAQPTKESPVATKARMPEAKPGVVVGPQHPEKLPHQYPAEELARSVESPARAGEAIGPSVRRENTISHITADNSPNAQIPPKADAQSKGPVPARMTAPREDGVWKQPAPSTNSENTAAPLDDSRAIPVQRSPGLPPASVPQNGQRDGPRHGAEMERLPNSFAPASHRTERIASEVEAGQIGSAPKKQSISSAFAPVDAPKPTRDGAPITTLRVIGREVPTGVDTSIHVGAGQGYRDTAVVHPERHAHPVLPTDISPSHPPGPSKPKLAEHVGQSVMATTGWERTTSVRGVTGGTIMEPSMLSEEDTVFPSAVQGEARTVSAAIPQSVIPRSRNEAVLVIRQLVLEAGRLQDGPIEIRLSPEELGTVRMQLSAGEAGMTVHVLADRPETLDLLRRHVDSLARELADAGYETAGFSFGAQGERSGNRHPVDGQGAKTGGGDEIVPRDIPRLKTDGIDIRL